MSEPKSYIIRNKKTGVQFKAPSGRTVWAKPGAAKCAFAQICIDDAIKLGIITRIEIDAKKEEYQARTGRPMEWYTQNTLVPKFKDQDLFEVVELKAARDTLLEEAVAILEFTMGRSEWATAQKIKEFLEKYHAS